MAEIIEHTQGRSLIEAALPHTLEPFRVGSRNDANQIALRLRDLLAVEGVLIDLASARGYVSEILGYRSWSHLLADIGGPIGLDDEIVDADVVENRRFRGYTALLPVVSEPSVIGRILTALAPTSCERHVTRTRRRYSDLCAPDAYHPVRLCMLVEQLDCDPTDEAEDDEEAVNHSALRADLAVSALVNFYPYDAYAIHEHRIRPMVGLARRVRDEPLRILDAESQALALAGMSFPTSVPGGDRYVHLGRHRFPSPYPGLGIEGCYVTCDAMGQIRLCPALSPPAEAAIEACEPDCLADHLLEHVRGHAMSLEAVIDGSDGTVLDPLPGREIFGSFDSRGRPPYAEGLDGLWRAFMRPVAAAALNALAVEAASASIKKRIGLPEFSDKTEITRFFKSHDAEERAMILHGLQASGSLPVVQILGTTKTEAETGFFAIDLPTDVRFWPTRHAGEWLKALSGDGFQRYARQDIDECLARFALASLSPSRIEPPAASDVAVAGAIVHEQIRVSILREDGSSALAISDQCRGGPLEGDLSIRVLRTLSLDLVGQRDAADKLGRLIAEQDRSVGLWLAALRVPDVQSSEAHRRFQVAWFHDPAFSDRVVAVSREGPPDTPADGDPWSSRSGIFALWPAIDHHCDVIRVGLARLRTQPARSVSRH